MQKKMKLAMNLQTFAEGTGEGSTAGGEGTNSPEGNQQPQIDYDKLASIVAGKQSATEESVLKGYFKQQGLSKEQMDQAIAAYKERQAANQPDVTGMEPDHRNTEPARGSTERDSGRKNRDCSYYDGGIPGNRSKNHSIRP